MRNTRLAIITKEEYRRNFMPPSSPPIESKPEIVSDPESITESEELKESELKTDYKNKNKPFIL